MSRKSLITLVMSLMILVLFAGCIRPASKVPFPTPSTGEKINTPLPVDQQILNATATALAIMEKFDQPTPTPKPQETTPPVQEGTEDVQTTQETAEATALPTQALTPTALPPTPVLTRPGQYTVHDGEHAYCLARRFDVDPADLLNLNGLTSNSYLSEGDVLTIPTSGSFPGTRALNPHPDTYTVSAGETIYSIACYYGDVAPESIIVVNGLVEPYALSGGQVLQIP